LAKAGDVLPTLLIIVVIIKISLEGVCPLQLTDIYRYIGRLTKPLNDRRHGRCRAFFRWMPAKTSEQAQGRRFRIVVDFLFVEYLR